MKPLLHGPMVQMAEPLVKWAIEVTRLEDLPRIVHRAAEIATTPPTGPVFISLPGDILNTEADIELGRSTRIDCPGCPFQGSGRCARQANTFRPTTSRGRRRRDREEKNIASALFGKS